MAQFARLARYDLARGFESNRARFALALVCIAALAALFVSAFDAASRAACAAGGPAASGFGVADVLAGFFAGVDYRQPDDRTPFLLPIQWLIQQVLVALLVGSYAARDLGGAAVQVLTRTGGRWTWWLAKCVWAVATVLAFYVLEAIVALALVAGAGGGGPMGDATAIAMLGFPLSAFDAPALAAALALPVALSVALSLAQVALSIVAGPFAAFLIVVAYGPASAFLGVSPFVGDCSMLARNAVVKQTGGVDAASALAGCALAGVAAAALGGVALRYRDVVGARKEDA